MQLITKATACQDYNMSASLSSIQYIDEDARSKAMLASTTASPHSLLNAEMNNTSSEALTSKVSLGKKLFEKQKQTVGETAAFTRSNSLRHGSVVQPLFKYGAVNSGFQIDDEEDDQEKTSLENMVELDVDASRSKLSPRAPTPPPRVDPGLASSVNAIDIDIDESCFKSIQINAFETTTRTPACIDIHDLFKHIDLLQAKLDQAKTTTSLSGSCASYESLLTTTTVTSAGNTLDAFSMVTQMDNELVEKLYAACNQDVVLLRKMCETANFRNTLGLYNKLIKLNATVSLKPVASNAQELANEVREIRFFWKFYFLFWLI